MSSSKEGTTGPLVKRMPWELDRSKGNKIPPKPTATTQPTQSRTEPSRFVTSNQQHFAQPSSNPSTTRTTVNNPPSNIRKPETQNNLREPTINSNPRPQSSTYASDEPAAQEIRKPSLSLLKAKQSTTVKK
jgi:hypothetical protein